MSWEESMSISSSPTLITPSPIPSSRTAAKKARTFVQHNYYDHSNDQVDDDQLFAGGDVAATFPIKLHFMLKRIEAEGRNDIASWAPHGRAFVVRKPQEFATLFLRKYFKQSKFASFQRQLNLYGFNRFSRGPDKGGYYHRYFLRSKPLLAHNIQRIKIKGTQVRQKSNPDQEPNFYSMVPVGNSERIGHQQPVSVPCPSITTPNTSNIVQSAARSPELKVESFTFSRKESRGHQFDDLMSAFGRGFHNVSTDQFHQRYNKPEDVASRVVSSSNHTGRLLNSVVMTKPSIEVLDDSPLAVDEDFAKILEDIVDL